MITRRVCIRTHGSDVLCTRPGPWGNPFVAPRDGNKEQVVAKHREWVRGWSDKAKREAIRSLKGKRLGCWCNKSPCHVDNLVNLCEGKL